MNWYLAELVLRVAHAHGGTRLSLQTHLVEAAGADEAYAKAMALGLEAEGELLGLHELTEIPEPLGDGAELAWQERPDVEAGRLVARREELGVFRAPPPPGEAGAPGADLRPPRVAGLHHAQIMIPPGGEAEARRFYGGLIGLTEIEKPAPLRARGGLWLQAGGQQLHIGVEAPGVDRRATRAHVAYEVVRLEALRARLEAARVEILDGEPVAGLRRFEVRDPFGNRVELVEPAR